VNERTEDRLIKIKARATEIRSQADLILELGHNDKISDDILATVVTHLGWAQHGIARVYTLNWNDVAKYGTSVKRNLIGD